MTERMNFNIKKLIVKYRQYERKNKRWIRPTEIISVTGLAFFCLVGLLYLMVIAGLYGPIPKEEELSEIRNHLSSEVYTSDGVILGRYYIENRTMIEMEDISENVITALIPTEDVRFYEHNGLDVRSVFRVIFRTIIGGDDASGGGSTITQQLAKNLYPREDHGLGSLVINKFQEVEIAKRLEKVYTKEEILTMYLNTISFGENVYGIKTASHRFFSKPPKELTLEDAAVLVGMLKATTQFNPRMNPRSSILRRNVVLSQMERYGYIPSETADSLRQRPLNVRYQNITHNEGPAPYFREHLRMELREFLRNHKKPDGSTYNLYTDGLRIHTSIDSRMQEYAENAVMQHIIELQDQFDRHWAHGNPFGRNEQVIKDAMRRTPRYWSLIERGYTEEQIIEVFNTPVPMTIHSFDGEISMMMTPMDSIRHYERMLNPGFVVMEPHTGFIKAWVGGADYRYHKYDNITARRSVGSTFKPIVYAAAMENGMSPCRYFSNHRRVYPQFNNWSPRNADHSYGGSYSLQGALTRSINVISVDVILRTGPQRVVELSRQMGIKSEIPPYPSIALGAAEISLLDMVQSYTAFPNRGEVVEPRYIMKIEDRDGNVIVDYREKLEKRRVLSTETADIMNEMLKSVVDAGTGRRIRWKYGVHNEMAGKTGTTQFKADGWWIGYTPTLIAGARVGANDQRVHFRTINLGQGANMALPIYAIFMAQLKEDEELAERYFTNFEIGDNARSRMNCAGQRVYDESMFTTDPHGIPADRIGSGDGRGEETSESEENRNIIRRIRNVFRSNENEEKSNETENGEEAGEQPQRQPEPEPPVEVPEQRERNQNSESSGSSGNNQNESSGEENGERE